MTTPSFLYVFGGFNLVLKDSPGLNVEVVGVAGVFVIMNKCSEENGEHFQVT